MARHADASCSSCAAPIPAASIAADLGAARCGACGMLNDLQGGRGARSPGLRLAELAPVPERWQVEDSGAGPMIRWRWFGLSALFLVPFTLFWNGILLTAGAAVASSGRPELLLFGLLVPHVWVGGFLVYWTLASLVNSTEVSAAGGRLRVRIGPLPWRGNREMATADVDQLFVVEHRGSKGSRTYDLCAVLRDGRKQTVVRGLALADQALFLESRLERALSIEDRPVAGELRGAR